MNNNNNNNNNPQNPTNPPNQQYQRPQYTGQTPQMPFQGNIPQRNRATTVNQVPGVGPGTAVGAQIRPSGSAIPGQRMPTIQPNRSTPGLPAKTPGTQMPAGAIRPPTMNGFQPQQNQPGANIRSSMIPGMPSPPQTNTGAINLMPAQGLRKPSPLSQSQRPIPQNIPGMQQKPQTPLNSPKPQVQPLQPMGFSSVMSQNTLRSSQDPPLLRSNSPLYPNTNLPNQKNQLPQQPINQRPQQMNQQPQQMNQRPQQMNQPPQQMNQPLQQISQPPQQTNQPPQQTNQPPQQTNQSPQQTNQPPQQTNQPPQQTNQPPQQLNQPPQQLNQPPQQLNQPPQQLNQSQQLNQQLQQLNQQSQQISQPPQQINIQPQQVGQPLQQINIQPQQIGQQPQKINIQPQQIGQQPQKINIQPPQIGQQPQQINQPPQQINIQPQQIGQPLQQINIKPQQVGQQSQQVGQPPQQINIQPQQIGQQPQQINIQPQQIGQQSQRFPQMNQQRPPQMNQLPQQNQIFIRPQQPQQKQQFPQQPTTNFQQMQLEMRQQQLKKQQEEFLKQQQLIQQEKINQQQKRILLQKKQEEMEKNEAQQRAFEENQQIQQQQILNKIAQTNDNFPLEQQKIREQQQSQVNPHPLSPQTPPSSPNQTPLSPPQPIQSPTSQPQPEQQPIQPPQIEPLTPPSQEPLQIEPLAPLSQQPLQIEPLTPLQQPPQLEPLVPPLQQPLQIEPLNPLQQQPQPLQVEPLVPPQQQPLQIEPLNPLQQQPQPLQVEPLVPPQQQPLQIEPLNPLQQQQPLQVEPLSPPQQQTFPIPPFSPSQDGQSIPPMNQLGTDPNASSQQNEGAQISASPFPSLNQAANSNFPQFSENQHKVNFGLDQPPVTLDFNEELSGDEDDTPEPQFRVRRSHTLTPNVGNNQRVTLDSTKIPKFFGRRETLMLQQGQKKRRNSSFQGCLVPELNEQAMKSVNGQIQSILDDPNSGMNQYSWSSHYVVNCVEEENPYVDPKAISLSMQAAGGNNNIVKLFSEKVRPLHFQKIEETPPAPPNTETQNILMLSDIADKTKPPTIAQLSDPRDIPNAADIYYQKSPPPPLLFTIEDMPIVGLSKRKYASFRIRDIKTEFDIIEPLFFGAFIVQDGVIISEQWTFTTKGSSQFIQDIPNITKASFQLPQSLENAYFCVVVSRFLLPENGATVNKYYLKPNAKSLVAAKNQALNYAEFTGVYAPFAFTYIDLKTVLDNKYFDLPPPFSVSTSLRTIIRQIKPGAPRPSETYPIYLIFDANILEASHIQDILAENTLLVRLASPLPLTPCYTFRHRLLVRMNQVNLHTTARNIYAELKVKSELGELPIFTTAYSNQKSKTIFTRCWYHDKKPFFDELFIIDLPLPLPKTLSLTITFFNASLKNVGQKGAETKEMIGVCTIPLIEGNSKILSDGEHQYPVDYRGQPSITTPAFNISTLLDSSLISTDSNLNKFYETVDSKLLEKCNDREVTINMFSIIDQIVNRFMDRGPECMKSLAILTKKKVSLDFNIIENCLNDYAIYFAFRNEKSQTPLFHRALLFSWAEFMKTNPDSNRTDSRLITFFFNMIIKSLYLTKDQQFSKEFSAFIIQWSKILDPQQIGDYARFLNILFDIGCYYYAVVAIECQMANLLNVTSKHQILIEFLTQVFRPKLFYSALVYVDRLKLNIIDMIKYSKRTDCTTLQYIYRTFLRLFAQYSEEMKQKIAERLINSLEILSPFESVHFIENDGNHPVIYYYCFILSCVSYEAFSNWLSHQIDHFADFFKTLHFMIDKIQDRELRRIACFAILHIISFIVQMKDVEGIIEATNIIYHFLCVDLPQDFICPLISTFSKLIEENYEILCVYSSPALPRHLAKLLNLTYLVPNEVYNLFKILYETDVRVFGSTLRSQAICYRSVSSLKSLDFIKLLPEYQQLPIFPIIINLQKIQQLTKSQLSEEKLTELIYQKAKMMFPSPDSTIECLNELIEYHRNHEYSAEEIQVLILQASIIFEFLVAQNKMDISYLNINEPSKLFIDLCPICERFRCPEGGNFIMRSYCDSSMFSERSLINHLIFIIERSMETKYHEIGYLLIDRIWPILEHRRIYTLLTNTFTRFGDCYKALAEIPPDEDRLFGHYFRICFYGNVFREENGNIYIYREKKLTHLFELTNRLVDYYTEVCKPTKIELIKESGTVDVSKLDPSQGYIQITFVEPYFPKSQNYTRVTSFERSHVLDSFFFDTPFTKGGNKAQASIDQQWVRRTVLHVEEPMPSIVKRIKVKLSEEIEFAPIRVAYRQIRDRINLLKNAIERSDYRAIQQLLHGSLLVQVNEGPSRMAEVFLGDQVSDESATEVYQKYKEKMKVAFKEFLTVNQKGIDLHGKYVEDHSVFIPLQHELESGFTALQEKISKYIQL